MKHQHRDARGKQSESTQGCAIIQREGLGQTLTALCTVWMVLLQP
jgi:hypothetical protein